MADAPASARPDKSDSVRLVLCPYCGHTQTRTDRCEQCRGLFEPLSRKATQIAMGPWYIRDKANPFRPGCSYETLKRQIEAGRIKPTTILRGPTTRQFWSVARNVPGVAHLLGYCPRCSAHVSPTDEMCPECAEHFIEPDERNELGLQYATRKAAEAAQRELERELKAAAGDSAIDAPAAGDAVADTTDEPTPTPVGGPGSPGADLLDRVVGSAETSCSPTAADKPNRRRLSEVALDFGPSDESTAPTHPVPPQHAPPSPASSPTVLVLATLNALAAAAVVVLAWMLATME